MPMVKLCCKEKQFFPHYSQNFVCVRNNSYSTPVRSGGRQLLVYRQFCQGLAGPYQKMTSCSFLLTAQKT